MILKNTIKKYLLRVRDFLIDPIVRKEFTLKVSDQEQLLLKFKYQELYKVNEEPLDFKDVGFQVYSQNEEDGILLFIFSLIGTTNKRCVEICAGDGLENCTSNLIVNHRWWGLLFDGNKHNIDRANQYFKNHPNTYLWPPITVCSWIDCENINDLITEQGFEGEIDLLSLDIDGIDYWLWKSIKCINPRVVVLEYNHLLGPTASVSVPYSPDFKCEFSQHGSDYAGASIGAFIKLGKEKGYKYIGSNEISSNAFFLRDDIECTWLKEADPKDFFNHPRAQFGLEKRFPNIKNKEWVSI
jgi:hypothetical protein